MEAVSRVVDSDSGLALLVVVGTVVWLALTDGEKG